MPAITPNHIDSSLTYKAYLDLIDGLISKGKTTGLSQTDKLIEYTRLNRQRMKRIGKQATLLPEVIQDLQGLEEPQYWVVLAEAWCGDAAQNLPILHLLAEGSPNIELRILLRDENPEVMDAYLTNGGRSIPKLVAIDRNSFEELWTWGPRPAPVQQIYTEVKKSPNFDKAMTDMQAQDWYRRDNGLTLQREIMALCEYIEM